MKKVILILLTLPYLAFSQQTIKMYGAKISASDITGKPDFGPKNELVVSKLMKDPVIKSSSDDNAVKDILGRFVISDMRSPSALLNMTGNKKLNELLDAINFEYYVDWAIPQILNKDATFSTDANYTEFKQRLSTLKTIAEKKALIGEDKYATVKQKLEESRLDFIEKDFTQDQSVVKTIKDKISANVSAALIENQLDLKAGASQELEKLVSKNITISGKYIEAYLKEKYIDYVEPKFKNYLTLATKPSDDFSPQLTSYFKNKNNKVITGVASIKIKIDYKATKAMTDSISAFVKGNFNLEGQKLLNVTADILASFDVDRKFTGTTSLSHYFILRYSYNTRLKMKNLQS